MEKKRRWDGLSVLKLAACVVVILLHCPFPGMLGEAVIYGLRFSVPCFFMISGYFAFGKPADWIKGKLLGMVKTTAIVEALYGVWNVIRALITGTEIEAITSLTALGVVKRVLFGSFFNGTLWYLYALIYSWLIVWLLVRKKWLEKAYAVVLPLLAVQIFGRFAVQNAFDIEKWVFLFCSAPLFGVPFMLLGHWCHAHEEALLKRLNLGRCVLLAMAGGVLIVAEYLLSGQYMDLHVSTVVLSMALFLGALNCGEMPAWSQPLVHIGKDLTGYTYFVHAFVISALTIALPQFATTMVFPVVVAVVSFAMATGVEKIIHMMKKA